MRKDNKTVDTVREAASRIQLSETEKKDIKAQILAFMEKDKDKIGKVIDPREKTEPGHKLFAFRAVRYAPILMAVIILLGGTAVSYAAKGALPGDILYAVKGFGEGAGLLFRLSTEDRIKEQIRLAGVKLSEVEALAAEGRLDEENISKLSSRFYLHASAVIEGIKFLQAENKNTLADELRAYFDAIIYTHTIIINRLADMANKSQNQINESFLKNESNAVVKIPAIYPEADPMISVEAEADSEVNAELQFKEINKKMSELKFFLIEKKKFLPPEIYAEAEVRIIKGDSMIEEARERLKAQVSSSEVLGIILNIDALIAGIKIFINSNEPVSAEFNPAPGGDGEKPVGFSDSLKAGSSAANSLMSVPIQIKANILQ